MNWFWLAIAASAAWGGSYVLSQHLLESLNPAQLLWTSSLVIFIGLSIYLTTSNQWLDLMDKLLTVKNAIMMLVYVFLYFLASVYILKSIDKSNASLAAIIESSYPLFTLFFAYLFLKEKQFNFGILIGVVLMIVGICFVNINAQKL